jgi:hypothetical protein
MFTASYAYIENGVGISFVGIELMAEQQPNPFEVVEQLNRAMYGDKASRSPGLFDKIDELTQGLNRLNDKLEAIEERKPSISKWTAGYFCFCIGGVFAVIAIINNIPGQQAYNIPTEMAAAIAVALGAIAFYFFLSGFGWIGKN